MSLSLRRRQSRFLFCFIILIVPYLIYTLIFLTETPTTSSPQIANVYFDTTELPNLIDQQGNDRYLKRNAFINISSTFQRGASVIQQTKRIVSRSDEEFGNLNVHIWDEICGDRLGSLRDHVLFPELPSTRSYTRKTRFSHRKDHWNYGGRIFGFVHPKKNGLYRFRVRGSSLEVWVSRNANPHLSKLVANIKGSSEREERFVMVMLAGEKYYMEMLFKKGEYKYPTGFGLQWKCPGCSKYTELSGSNISRMLNDDHLRSGQVDSIEPVKGIQIIHNKVPFPTFDDVEQLRTNLHRLPLLTDEFLENVLPRCEYRPSYLANGVVTGYDGIWLTHYNSLYPIDKTNVTRSGWVSLGNDILQEKKALDVIYMFIMALNNAKTRKFRLSGIISVEEKHDKIKGDRYLLELVLQEIKNGRMLSKPFRLSKYVYKPKGSPSLCYPEGYQWNRNATVNIVLTVGGNQGRWVQHFINNVAGIYRETKDKNLNVVIMDFNSKGIDIKSALKKSGLPRYMLLRMNTKFHKTLGLQYAVKAVTNPDDIVFVCDLHFHLPVTIVDHIRKHCIQGKTAFNPVLLRLDCGFTSNNQHGRWENVGYGPMATFKSDWVRFGGMNVERFKHRWGGEDWDMLDRILSAGYEIERLKILNFVHFFHSKKGMWDKSG